MKINILWVSSQASLALAAMGLMKHKYAELCHIVDEWTGTLKKDGKPLPPPTAGMDLAKKLSDAA